MGQSNEKSVWRVILGFYIGILQSMTAWVESKPNDPTLLKIIKFAAKILLLILCILLSPIVLLTLLIAFLLAL